MRYRYQLRNLAGEIISRHSSYLGALDALAAIRATAQREGWEPDIDIVDVSTGEPVTTSDSRDAVADLTVRLTPEERERLRDVARSVGALAERGRWVGTPSEAQLVRQIASGELTVSRARRRPRVDRRGPLLLS